MGEDPILLTLELERARLLLEDGEDLGALERRLRGVERKILDDGHDGLKRDFFLVMNEVQFQLGRFAAAESSQRRLLALAQRIEDPFSEATARLNLAIIQMARPPRRGGREKSIGRLQEALTAAATANQLGAEIECHIRLGRLLEGPARREHLETGVLLARRFGDPALLASALRALASQRRHEDPDSAVRLIAQARQSAQATDSPWSDAYGWADRWRVSWATRSPEEALAESLTTLDLIDGLRDLQRAQGARAEMFSVWTEAYYWLSGHLLESATRGGVRTDLAHAWTITERMRARVLLEALDALPRSAEQSAPASLQEEHREVLESLVAVNRLLLDPSLSAERRSAALEELEALERRDGELRDPPRDSSQRWVHDALVRHDFATLDQVETHLRGNEALFSFQVGTWHDVYGEFAGGSWLVVSTRQGSRAYKLSADSSQLKAAVAMFSGLMTRRDDPSTATFAASLFEQLLAPAIADLPPSIDRLVIIPDGSLHMLPFAVLHGLDDPPLAARYQLSIVPSATLWLRFRQSEATPAEIPVLAWIDPLPAGRGSPLAAEERAWPLAEGALLGSLPHARKEGRSIVRHLGNASRRLIGPEASERAVKQSDLAKVGILHFAAHAVLDDEYPDRSAIVLAPGDKSEDGLLQPPEIARLELEGKVIVLSACQGASGLCFAGKESSAWRGLSSKRGPTRW